MTKQTKILFIVSDIHTLNIKKDTSFAMMLAAHQKGYQVFCCHSNNLSIVNQTIIGRVIDITPIDCEDNYLKINSKRIIDVKEMDIVLMRKDPPFDINYIYTTYLLEQLQQKGVLVYNNPKALRDFNEKLAILQFPHCIPKTIVSSDKKILSDFIAQNEYTIVKPLGEMGGKNIYKCSKDDNYIKILQQITNQFQTPIMAQIYLNEITKGDKRILIINGEPIPYCLVRIPKKGQFKGNLAAGAKGVGQMLTERDYWLCKQIKTTLVKNDLNFVGLDVIGDYITEINITSPTGIREIDQQFNTNIANDYINHIDLKLKR